MLNILVKLLLMYKIIDFNTGIVIHIKITVANLISK